MFDAPVYLASIEPPVFVDLYGKKRIGRVLGTDHWLKLQSRLRLARANDMNPAELNAAMIGFVEAVFPHSRWKFWEKSVAWHVGQLPQEGRVRAVWDFMQSQAKALGMEADSLGTFPTSTAPTAVPLPA